MERNGQLDAVSCTSIRGALTFLALALLSLFCRAQLWAQDSASFQPDAMNTAGALSSAQPRVSTSNAVAADAQYSQGLALAQAGLLADAEAAFLRGNQLSPKNARFATELGGIAFKQKKYAQAIRWLRRAQKLAPDDDYIHDFLGTLYFIEGRQDAAIDQWNRVGRPVVEEIKMQSPFRVDPVVLDRSFAFSRGETLNLADWWATDARLRALGIYPMFTLRMIARPDGKLDLSFTAQERDGFGSKWDALLGTFGGIFYETVTPEYYNIGGTATNVTALLRWDDQKRRVAAIASGPLRRNPRWRYRAGVDLRNENWDIRNFSSVAGGTLGFLNMRRSAGGADVTSLGSGKLTWSVGSEISYRDFRSVASASFSSGLLIQGYQLKQRASLTYDVLRLPEKQYRMSVKGWSELARVWDNGGSVFEKVQAELSQTWTLTDHVDGPQITGTVRAGKTFGGPPFDEFFMLGVERDNDLMMRAHLGTDHAGRNGNAPLGRNYFVSNNDMDKKVWGNGLIAVRLGPFVDVGKITDPLAFLGSKEWLVDAGGEAKLRVLGLQIRATYGRDLRTGHGALYTWVGK